MGTQLNDRISVGAVFTGGAPAPAWFVWNGRRYTVTAVTMRWRTAEGSATVLHLGVTDGTNLFELTLNQQTLVWQLRSVDGGGGNG